MLPSLYREHHLSLVKSIVPGVNIVAEAAQAVLEHVDVGVWGTKWRSPHSLVCQYVQSAFC